MKGKLIFLAGMATGLLLGSQAARRAYQRMTAKVTELWGDPAMHDVIAQAETIARNAASVAQSDADGHEA